MELIGFILGLAVLVLTTVAGLCVGIEILLRKKDSPNERLISLIDSIGKCVVILVVFVAIPAFFVNKNLSSKSAEEIANIHDDLSAAQTELNFLKTDRSLTDKQKQILFDSLQHEHGKIIISSIIGREPQSLADELFVEFSKSWDAKRIKMSVNPNKDTVGVALLVHSEKAAPSFTKAAYWALNKADLNPVLGVHASNKVGELVLLVGEKIPIHEQERKFPGSTVKAELSPK